MLSRILASVLAVVFISAGIGAMVVVVRMGSPVAEQDSSEVMVVGTVDKSDRPAKVWFLRGQTGATEVVIFDEPIAPPGDTVKVIGKFVDIRNNEDDEKVVRVFMKCRFVGKK